MIPATRRAYLTLWAATALASAAARAGIAISDPGAPYDALAATPGTVLELLAHNAVVALWPLALVALGWPAIPGARRVGDALIGAQLVSHGALAGAALGAHPETWRYLPHLPLEWLALAIPAGAWLTARRTRPPSTALALSATAPTLAMLALAAIIETYLVPL